MGTGEILPNRVFFRRDVKLCRNWCADGDVFHLGMHPIDICFIGFIDPFFSCLSDFILYFPLRHLGFTPSGDLLAIRHDAIHDRCFASIIFQTLCGVMA